MRILVTGGAGLIGGHVVDLLVRTGHDVISIVRQPRPPGAELAAPTREVVGDVADRLLVDRLMSEGVEAVVHLAAIPAPVGHTAVELLTANALTTMTVLESAGRHGVRHLVIASSVSALGMAWCEHMMHPLYVPIDEAHPLRPTEGYALSKEDDEAAARMAARRWRMTVVALRFPFTATARMIHDRAAAVRRGGADAVSAAKELWAYLDVRDAAVAIADSLYASVAGRIGGSVVLNVMADDVLSDAPLRTLLALWHPEVPVTEPLSRGAYSITRARELIGFDPQYLLHRGSRAEYPQGEQE